MPIHELSIKIAYYFVALMTCLCVFRFPSHRFPGSYDGHAEEDIPALKALANQVWFV